MDYQLTEYTVLRKDNDGHKYVIPSDRASEFDKMLDSINSSKFGTPAYYDLNDALDAAFGLYMVG